MSNRDKIIIQQLKKMIIIRNYIRCSNNNKNLLDIEKRCISIIEQLLYKTEKEIKELKKIKKYLKGQIKKEKKHYIIQELLKEKKEVDVRIAEGKEKLIEYKSYL
jgi:hypothetical protein